jgi:hypothetical protein
VHTDSCAGNNQPEVKEPSLPAPLPPMRHLSIAFSLGVLSASLAALAAVFASEAAVAQAAGVLLVWLCIGVALTTTGFAAGRADNAFSSAPIRNRWRLLVAGALGLASGLLSIPVGFLLLLGLAGTGVWQPLLCGLWCLAVGGLLGYLYGPIFRCASKLMPFLREGEHVS